MGILWKYGTLVFHIYNPPVTSILNGFSLQVQTRFFNLSFQQLNLVYEMLNVFCLLCTSSLTNTWSNDSRMKI